MKPLFKILSANEWLELAAKTSASTSLYRDFWHEGEIVCLMDKARTGKTALALRIASEIAASRQVLFIDFAASMRRFAGCNKGGFAPGLRRLQIDRDALEEAGPEGLMERIEEAVKASGIKTIVIDSLTWLCNFFRKTDAARWFMRAILGMRRRLGLSVLVVAEPTRRIEPFLDNIASVAETDPQAASAKPAPVRRKQADKEVPDTPQGPSVSHPHSSRSKKSLFRSIPSDNPDFFS